MHQALQVSEILDLVCSFADESTLPRLARTCRTFEDSSLTALWNELPSAEYILNRLLRAIFKRSKEHDHRVSGTLVHRDPS